MSARFRAFVIRASCAIEGRRRALIEAGAALGLMLAMLVSAYSPVLTTNFFFYDDYFQLARADVPLRHILPGFLSAYRPGYVVWLWLVTKPDSTIGGGAYVRMLGVVGLSFLCLLLYAWARRRGFSRTVAFGMASLAFLAPAFQSTIGYASNCVSAYCALFSALAAVMVIETWTAPNSSRMLRAGAIVGAALLIAVAMGTYQPPTMFCWVFVAVAWRAPVVEDWRRLMRATCAFGFAFVAGHAIIYVVVKAMLAALSIRPLGRTTLLGGFGEVVDKLQWFWGEVVPQAFLRVFYAWSERLWMSQSVAGWVVAILLVLLMLAPWLRRQPDAPWRFRMLQSLSPLVLLMLAYTPFLIIHEKGYLTGYFTALESVLIVVFVSAMDGLLKRAQLARAFATAALLGAVIVSLVTCNRNMMQVYVIPNVTEYRYVKSVLSQVDLSQVSHIHVKGHLHFSSVLSYGEMLVLDVLREFKPPHEITVTSSTDEIPEVIHDDIVTRSPQLLLSAYTMTPHGYYALRGDISPERREEVRAYFASLPALYKAEGALMIDMGQVKEMVGVWKGML